MSFSAADEYSSATSLEVDTESYTSDGGSTFGGPGSARTQSLTSSVYKYMFENGRRYHSYREGHYLLPNDDKEQDRLDLQHHLFRVTNDGRLYLAPVPESVQSVLDIGCGTGIWAIEFAEEHPGSQVLGIDLSPIQPNVIPSNCAFRVDDVEQHWMEDEKFDFIHSRAMIGGIKDWPRLIKTAFEHLNPGGFLELQDLCFPSRSDNPVHHAESKVVKYHHHLIEAASRLGLNFHAPLKWADQLREAGFVDIHLKWFNWPVGPWPKGKKNKLMGQWTLADFIDGSEAPIALFTRVLGWTTEEFHGFVAQCREEMKEQKMHIYVPVCFCYARKPE